MTFNAAPIYSLKWKGDERRIFEQDQEKIISVLLLNFDFFSLPFPFISYIKSFAIRKERRLSAPVRHNAAWSSISKDFNYDRIDLLDFWKVSTFQGNFILLKTWLKFHLIVVWLSRDMRCRLCGFFFYKILLNITLFLSPFTKFAFSLMLFS